MQHLTRSRGVRAGILVTALALVAALAWWLPIAEWVVSLADQLRAMGATGVILFIAIYIVAEVFLLPGSIFTLAAGFAYGPVVGLLVVSPASVLAATAAFLLARTVLRDWIKARIARYPKARALDTAIGRNSFKLILRLSPAIPFNILNYALGLSDAQVGRYVVASFIGMLPGTWMYVYLGSLATTAATLTDAGEAASTQRLALTLIGFAATVAVVIVVTRAARRALDEELARTGA